MKFWHLLLLIAQIAGVVIFLASQSKGTRGGNSSDKPHGRRPLTDREQAMYFRLREALPDQIVLAQVAMSALMTAKTTSLRNMFDRKVVDFVVCTKAFEVIAVIELDDSSHKGKEAADDRRDKLVQRAGFKAIRFLNLPTVERIRLAVFGSEASMPATGKAALT